MLAAFPTAEEIRTLQADIERLGKLRAELEAVIPRAEALLTEREAEVASVRAQYDAQGRRLLDARRRANVAAQTISRRHDEPNVALLAAQRDGEAAHERMAELGRLADQRQGRVRGPGERRDCALPRDHAEQSVCG